MQGAPGFHGQVYVSPEGYGAAGPISAEPELLARLLQSQRRPGYQVYSNTVPQGMPGMPIMLTMSPERSTPERQIPASPGTAMFMSPSMDNYRK